MSTESLKATEAECAEGRTAPRVSLADIEANIVGVSYFTAGEALFALHGEHPGNSFCNLDILTIAIVVCQNGFVLVGKSAPASADNFDVELGRKLAYEDAVRQIWPLMGYALRHKLYEGETE